MESLTRDIHDMQEKESRLDERERRARQALLVGITAYLRALNGNGNGDGKGGEEHA